MTEMQAKVIAAMRAVIVNGRWPRSGRLVTRQERRWLLTKIDETEAVVRSMNSVH